MKTVFHAEGKGVSPALRWLFSILFLIVWAAAVGIAGIPGEMKRRPFQPHARGIRCT